jgi:hypothetical protein
MKGCNLIFIYLKGAKARAKKKLPLSGGFYLYFE